MLASIVRTEIESKRFDADVLAEDRRREARQAIDVLKGGGMTPE
jgi:hypothetical protein